MAITPFFWQALDTQSIYKQYTIIPPPRGVNGRWRNLRIHWKITSLPTPQRSLWINTYHWFEPKLYVLYTIYCRQCTPHQTPQRDLWIDTYHWFLAELNTISCRQCPQPPPNPNPKRSLWRYKGTWFEPKLHVLVGLLRVILHASIGADWWRKHLSKKQEEMSDITI